MKTLATFSHPVSPKKEESAIKWKICEEESPRETVKCIRPRNKMMLELE
jgi:hypothetical protein